MTDLNVLALEWADAEVRLEAATYDRDAAQAVFDAAVAARDEAGQAFKDAVEAKRAGARIVGRDEQALPAVQETTTLPPESGFELDPVRP